MRAALIGASTCFSLLSIEGAFSQPPPATLTVRVENELHAPLSAIVYRVGAPNGYLTNNAGIAHVNVPGCDGSVVLVVKARGSSQYNDEQRTVACSPDPDPFRLTRSQTASLSDPAYAYLRANLPANPQLVALRSSLAAAIERGQDAEVASLARDLAEAVQAEGDPALANAFRAMAQQAGVRAIASDPALNMDRYLSVSSEGQITATPDGVLLVRHFQREVGLPASGRFNPRTIGAIGDSSRMRERGILVRN